MFACMIQQLNIFSIFLDRLIDPLNQMFIKRHRICSLVTYCYHLVSSSIILMHNHKWRVPLNGIVAIQYVCIQTRYIIAIVYLQVLSCAKSLHWRHNEHDGVSNHQPHQCLLRLFMRTSKKTSKLRVTGLVRGIHRGPANSPQEGQ